MPQFFSSKKFILLLVGMITLVALIGFTLRERENASVPEQIVKDIVGFGQSLVAKPANYITNVFKDIDALLNTYNENKVLKENLNEFASVEAELYAVQAENERLREAVQLNEALRNYTPVNATVIARNPDQWEEKIILDKGSSAGIEKNMAVLTPQGLIGKVNVVTPFTSEVQLLFSNNTTNRISATVQAKMGEVNGLIEGFDTDRRELIMKRIDSSKVIEVGEKVVTSGLGGIFPQGIVVGEITEVTTVDYGLTQTVYIKPAANYELIDFVIIAKRSITSIDGIDGTSSDSDLTNDVAEQAETEGES